MAGNSEHIPDFETFQRYHNGAMSPGEQHMFEKQMLQDPGLSDAYEGFLAMQRDKVDFSAVKETLEQHLKNRVVGPEKRTFPVWTLDVAAATILSIGVIWLAFLSNPEKRESLTKAPEQVSQRPSLAEQQLEIKPTPEPLSAPKITLKSSNPEPNVPSETESATPDDSNALLEVETESLVAVENVNSLSASVPAQSDEASFKFGPPSGARAAQPAAVRRDSLVRKSEVLASQAATVKPSLAASRPERNISKTTSAKPLMGWVSYQLYLEQKADSVGGIGEVNVSFKVNADGTLSDFNAVGDKALFEDAIRIVRSGPAWVPAKRNETAIPRLISVQLRFKK